MEAFCPDVCCSSGSAAWTSSLSSGGSHSTFSTNRVKVNRHAGRNVLKLLNTMQSKQQFLKQKMYHYLKVSLIISQVQTDNNFEPSWTFSSSLDGTCEELMWFCMTCRVVLMYVWLYGCPYGGLRRSNSTSFPLWAATSRNWANEGMDWFWALERSASDRDDAVPNGSLCNR